MTVMVQKSVLCNKKNSEKILKLLINYWEFLKFKSNIMFFKIQLIICCKIYLLFVCVGRGFVVWSRRDAMWSDLPVAFLRSSEFPTQTDLPFPHGLNYLVLVNHCSYFLSKSTPLIFFVSFIIYILNLSLNLTPDAWSLAKDCCDR